MVSPHNASATVEKAQDFNCCCSITHDEFTGIITGFYISNCIVLVLTSISATLGNLLVLVSIWRTPSLHSPSNVLLFGLAVSDLGVGLVVEPTAFIFNIARIKGLVQVFCNSLIALRFSGALLCFASLFTITAISVDMYIALYLHLRYREIVTVKRMTGVLVGIWLSSITFSLLYLWYYERIWTLWISLIVLCLVVTTSAYYKVFRIVLHHHGQIHAQAQVQVREQAEDQEEDPTSIAEKKKALVTKFLIYCLLLVCYLPYMFIAVLKVYMRSSITTKFLFDISFSIMYLNSTLNPFVYCWRFHNIRAALIQATRKIF